MAADLSATAKQHNATGPGAEAAAFSVLLQQQRHHHFPALRMLIMHNRDELIAEHVEALVGLGWRWEGRGLIPTWLPGELFQQREQKSTNLDSSRND